MRAWVVFVSFLAVAAPAKDVTVNAQPFPTQVAYEGSLKTQILGNQNAIRTALDATCTSAAFFYAGHRHCAQVVFPASITPPEIILGEGTVPNGQPWKNDGKQPAHRPGSTPEAALGAVRLELTKDMACSVSDYGDDRGNGELPRWYVECLACFRKADGTSKSARTYSWSPGPIGDGGNQWVDAELARCWP